MTPRGEGPLEGLKARPSSPPCGYLRDSTKTKGKLCAGAWGAVLRQRASGIKRTATSLGLDGVAAGEGWKTREGVGVHHWAAPPPESPFLEENLQTLSLLGMAARDSVGLGKGQTLPSHRTLKGTSGSLTNSCQITGPRERPVNSD